MENGIPARDGDLLNLRECATSNRALDQMKCVSNLGADMRMMPIDAPGQSDVEVTVKHAKPWSVAASVDKSGTRATGM
ncbi:hypothetical protein [Paraburkholderia sp. 2C]